MKTPEEIDIANRELAYADNYESNAKWQVKIKRLKLQKEIAIIKKKIEQLG